MLHTHFETVVFLTALWVCGIHSRAELCSYLTCHCHWWKTQHTSVYLCFKKLWKPYSQTSHSCQIEGIGAFCCAFSAVLFRFGHSLTCEARTENVSHRAIMSNPPPPFPSSFFPSFSQPSCRAGTDFVPLPLHTQKTRLCSLLCWTTPVEKHSCVTL